MIDRKQAILRHVARYQLGTNLTVSELFLQGKAADHVVRSFAAKNLVRVFERTLGNNQNHFLITDQGRKLCGLDSGERPKVLAPEALNKRVGVLSWCAQNPKHRVLLYPSEVRKHLDRSDVSKQYKYVLSTELELPCILRVYFAGASKSPVSSAKDHVRSLLSASRTKPLGKAIAERKFGVLALAQSPELASDITEAIEDSGLSERIPVVVGTAPSAASFGSSENRMRASVGSDG